MCRTWHKPEIKFLLFYWHALNGNPWYDICPYIVMDGIFARRCKGCWKGRLYLHSTGSMSTNQYVCRRRSVMFSVLKVLKRIVGHLGEIFSCLSIIQKGKGPVVGLHSSSSYLLLIQDTPLRLQLTFLFEPDPINFMLIPPFPVHEEAAIQKSKHK